MFHYIKTVFPLIPELVHKCVFVFPKFTRENSKYSIEHKYKIINKFVRKVVKRFQAEVYVEGLENLPKDSNYCLVSNHLSSFDPLLIMSNIDSPTTFVAKIETKKLPVVPQIIKGLDGLFLERDNLKQSFKVMMEVEKDLKKGEKNWLIFPEGTRNKDHMALLKEFHHGTFRPAMKANVPIVPVAIFGTFRILKIKPQYKKYPLFIKYLPPIYPKDYEGKTTHEVAKMAEEMIQKTVSYELRKKDHEIMNKLNKNYKFGK